MSQVKEYTYSTEPREFTINGELFKAHGVIALTRLVELQNRLKAVQGSDDLETTIEELKRLFSETMPKESYDRFLALVDHPEIPIPLQLLGDIMIDLVSGYSEGIGDDDDADPTESPSDSSSGQTKTGGSSKGARSSRASTSKKSTRAKGSA